MGLETFFDSLGLTDYIDIIRIVWIFLSKGPCKSLILLASDFKKALKESLSSLKKSKLKSLPTTPSKFSLDFPETFCCFFTNPQF